MEIILGIVIAIALCCWLLLKCFCGAAVAVQGYFHNSLLTQDCCFCSGFSSSGWCIAFCAFSHPRTGTYPSLLNAELHIPGSCGLRNSQFFLRDCRPFCVSPWVLSGLVFIIIFIFLHHRTLKTNIFWENIYYNS